MPLGGEPLDGFFVLFQYVAYRYHILRPPACSEHAASVVSGGTWPRHRDISAPRLAIETIITGDFSHERSSRRQVLHFPRRRPVH